MSLVAATTCEGSVQQYCNYGYDKEKYSSYEDCISKKTKEDCKTTIRTPSPMTSFFSSAGAIAGIYYGIKTKKSFWGTVGYTILFSIGGAALGTAINTLTNKN